MLTSEGLPTARERIIVALDCEAEKAFEVADALRGRALWLKVGMTLFYEYGPAIVRAFKDRGFKVFLDLKFHDIPHQVKGAAAAATASGADMLTMHAMGGVDMMQAANEGVKLAATKSGAEVPLTLGITVLTSMSETALAETGVTRRISDQVVFLATQTQRAGLSGVVASPWEAAELRGMLGPEALIVTPGVRLAGAEKDDQSRVATPAKAFEAGASHIVIGRPITISPHPVEAFESIVEGL